MNGVFFWNQFIDSVNIPNEHGLVQVPGPWTKVKLKNGNNPTPKGYASYVLEVRGLKEGQELGITSANFFSNYRVYKVHNGKITSLFEIGLTGKKKKSSIPHFLNTKNSFFSGQSPYWALQETITLIDHKIKKYTYHNSACLLPYNPEIDFFSTCFYYKGGRLMMCNCRYRR